MDKNILDFRNLLEVTLKHRINNELMKIVCLTHELPPNIANDISKSVYEISSILNYVGNIRTIKTKPYIEGVQMLDLEESVNRPL